MPALILEIADIPYTINGKKVEVAVKKILNGQKVLPGDVIKCTFREAAKKFIPLQPGVRIRFRAKLGSRTLPG